MKRFGGLLILITLASIKAQAFEDSLAICAGAVELEYRQSSERLISMFSLAKIDRFEFEKFRTDALNRREQGLRQCSEQETFRLRQEFSRLNQALTTPQVTHGRSPASFNSAYEELKSNYEPFDE